MLAKNYRTYKPTKPKQNDYTLAKIKTGLSFKNDAENKFIFNESVSNHDGIVNLNAD